MKKTGIASLLVAILFATGLFAQNTSRLDDSKLTEFAYKLSKLPFSERDVIDTACVVFEKMFEGDPDNADWGYQLLYFYHQLSCEDKTITLHKTFSDEEIRALVHRDIKVLGGLMGDMKKFENEYGKFGYRIMSFEDTSYAIEVQPAFLYDKFQKMLTSEYRYYRGLWIKEHDIPTVWHAALNIPLSEVFERIQWRDEFMEKNPDFIREDLVTREIEHLCFTVTKGLENTPVYDDKDVIKPEYKAALQEYYRAHEETKWGKYMTEYVHRLALNKYRNSYKIDRWVLDTLFPIDRKNIDPLLKYKDILIDNIIE